MKKQFLTILFLVLSATSFASNKIAFNLTEIKDTPVSHSIAYIDETLDKDSVFSYRFRLYEDGKEIMNNLYYGDNIRLVEQKEGINTVYILQDDYCVYVTIFNMTDGCTLDVVPDDKD